MDAASQGELTPDEAKAFSDLVDGQYRALFKAEEGGENGRGSVSPGVDRRARFVLNVNRRGIMSPGRGPKSPAPIFFVRVPVRIGCAQAAQI